MGRHAAFLRAINVGKRRVKMAALRAHFEAMGFDAVETLIASGNVAFSGEGEGLAERIEGELRARLGFEVPTAVRRRDEVAAVVARAPFEMADADVLHVSFLVRAPDPEAGARVAALSCEADRLQLEGDVLYWRRRGRLSDTTLDTKALDRAVGVPHTLRKVDTVRKMLALLGPPLP